MRNLPTEASHPGHLQSFSLASEAHYLASLEEYTSFDGSADYRYFVDTGSMPLALQLKIGYSSIHRTEMQLFPHHNKGKKTGVNKVPLGGAQKDFKSGSSVTCFHLVII